MSGRPDDASSYIRFTSINRMFSSLNNGLQSQVHKVSQFKLLASSYSPEDEFLNVIGTKVIRVFLLAIHSHLYLRILPPLEQKWFETGL
jgi:hypothetical protein